MPKIKEIHAREILDSRGDPTVEVDVTLEDGSFGRASVPSGASTGTHEALELRDADKARYLGKGVLHAVRNINTEIRDALVGQEGDQQRRLDELMIRLDGTENKARLGANAILGVSLALAKAAAVSMQMSLYRYLRRTYNPSLPDQFVMPVPMMNIINGGKHADGTLDFQEFIIFPIAATNINEVIRMGSEIFHALAPILKSNHISTNVGNEGGYAGDFAGHSHATKLILQAIENAGYKPGIDAYVGMDVAAGSFYEAGKYAVKSEGALMSREGLVDYLASLVDRYPIISIEDPLFEDDWEGWHAFTARFGKKMQVVGDDLFVTNVKRIQKGIEEGAANAVLIKPNQIGSLSETVDAILLAQKAGYRTVVSHRSGETEDSFIADLVVALNCGQIKTGSMSRSERLTKYNRLMQIAEELGDKATYLGKATFDFLK
ncbi:MAG: phosphopyruvate hydratase [Patescibacteria group bacterium]